MLLTFRNVLTLNSACYGDTVNRVPTKTITKVIYTHFIGIVLFCFKFTHIISVVGVRVGLAVSEIDHIRFKLELILESKRAKLLKRIRLLLVRLLTLQVLDVHYFSLTTLSATITLVSNVFTSPMPPYPGLFKLFSAKDEGLHSFLEWRVWLCHVDDVYLYICAALYVKNTKVKPLCARTIRMSIVLEVQVELRLKSLLLWLFHLRLWGVIMSPQLTWTSV